MLIGFFWGAIVGTFLGWLSPVTIDAIGVWVGLPELPPGGVGAAVGFVGGAFKSRVTANSSSR